MGASKRGRQTMHCGAESREPESLRAESLRAERAKHQEDVLAARALENRSIPLQLPHRVGARRASGGQVAPGRRARQSAS
jgi:hypothetical protein